MVNRIIYYLPISRCFRPFDISVRNSIHILLSSCTLSLSRSLSRSLSVFPAAFALSPSPSFQIIFCQFTRILLLAWQFTFRFFLYIKCTEVKMNTMKPVYSVDRYEFVKALCWRNIAEKKMNKCFGKTDIWVRAFQYIVRTIGWIWNI